MIFGHTGDLGDIVAALPAVRELGGGDFRIGVKPEGQRESMKGARFDAIKPLLEAQPYIKSCEWTEDFAGVDHDFSLFRKDYERNGCLAVQQARHVGIQKVDLSPWLTVKTVPHGRPVIARSSRYWNPNFSWRLVLNRYPNPIFVGLPDEHMDFQVRMSQRLEYRPTQNLLQMAEIIAGARILSANQTAAWWIGAGLGVPLIQESWSYDQNSVIRRKNCRYTRTEEELREVMDGLRLSTVELTAKT